MDPSKPAASFVARPSSHDHRPVVPVIETDRLRLRGHRLEDYDECVEMWSDPAVYRFIGGKPSSPQQTWARLCAYVGHWSLLQFGYWLLEEKTSGSFVGEIGFADFKRDIAPSMKGFPELGFALARRCQGKGLATEATRAVLAWADAHLSATRTVCIVDPENAASLRLVQNVSYEIFARETFAEKPTLFLARNRTPK
jgi:RimJ/RimL family protein N-acetyltransferase